MPKFIFFILFVGLGKGVLDSIFVYGLIDGMWVKDVVGGEEYIYFTLYALLTLYILSKVLSGQQHNLKEQGLRKCSPVVSKCCNIKYLKTSGDKRLERE